jgi:hypothetical protein
LPPSAITVGDRAIVAILLRAVRFEVERKVLIVERECYPGELGRRFAAAMSNQLGAMGGVKGR